MGGNTMKHYRKGAVAAVLLAASTMGSYAAENGNTQFAPGSSQFFAGAIPPFPGLYLLSQTNHYSANRLNDGNGNKMPIDFNVEATAETLRFLYVSDLHIGSAQVWGQVVLPVVGLNLKTPFAKGDNIGLGDAIVAAGLAWHPDRAQTFVLGLDMAMPTGLYDKNDVASIGLNHWSFQPTVGYHYLDPQGPEIGIAARAIFNTENDATGYTSGNELVVDYAAGWNFGKLRVGAVGYYLKQFTDDSGPRVPADGNRGEAFAIGPSLSYTFDTGMQLSASWQHEAIAKHRAQGNALWANLALKF